MNPAQKITVICDELLATTGLLRRACAKAGAPWPTSEAAQIIDRLLDIRNQVNFPKKKTTTDHAK